MSSILLDTPREVLVKLYIEQDIPLRKLAALFSVSESTMTNTLKKHGISKGPIYDSPTVYEVYQRKAFLRGYAFELTEQQFYSLIASMNRV